jgi:hypothetical protein
MMACAIVNNFPRHQIKVRSALVLLGMKVRVTFEFDLGDTVHAEPCLETPRVITPPPPPRF